MAADQSISPRTLRLLLIAAEILRDEGREDLEREDPNHWFLFDRYPPITHRRDAHWRRRALRSYETLAADIDAGTSPIPRCTADEVALWLMIDLASAIEEDRDAWESLWRSVQECPARRNDFNWDELREILFQDTDFLMLYSPELDGIEDPTDPVNAMLRIGPFLQPQEWFTPFGLPPQDG